MTPNPSSLPTLFRRMAKLLKPPPPDRERQVERLKSVERDVMLPVKGVFLVVLAYYLYVSPWMVRVESLQEVVQEFVQNFYVGYLAFNVVVAWMLLAMKRFSIRTVQWVLFVSGLLDGVVLAALTVLTDGFQSILYWFFPALIVRHAIILPLATQQITLNLAVSFCYLLAGLLHVGFSEADLRTQPRPPRPETVISNQTATGAAQVAASRTGHPALDPRVRHELGLDVPENPTEPFLLRMIVLLLMTMYCYVMQMLFEKQRLEEVDAREFATRQEQLDSAGRLSSQIAHQIKNPLGIINNAAFNLQKLVPAERVVALKQIEIIREEVERADRIITELLGYAKLADARLERLEPLEELERAVGQVFPGGAQYAVEIVRDYEADLPQLIMQRGHVSEIFVNLLQNAREAMDGRGRMELAAATNEEGELTITIGDSGPGIPPERLEQIFEAYFTTKPKGTGLGLAIVRHSVDLYGGRVRVESELGKGTRFSVILPPKVLSRKTK